MTNDDILEKHKDVVRRMVHECWVNRNIDAAGDFIAADAIDHNPVRGQVQGVEGMREKWKRIHEIFPDAELTIDQLIAEGDRVVLASTVRGTHLGPLMGIPGTGKPVTIRAIDILRFERGKIVEAESAADMLDVLVQLGLTPGRVRGGAST